MQLAPGTKVTYKTPYKEEKGIVKSRCNSAYVFVVYNCAGDWDNYEDYTAAKTRVEDLVEGW